MGVLAYGIASGGHYLWIDLRWQSLADADQPHVLTAQLLDLGSGRKVSLSPDITAELQSTDADASRGRRIPMSEDIPQGEYRLGVQVRFSADAVHETLSPGSHDGEPWSAHEFALDVPILVLPATLREPSPSEDGRIVAYTPATEGIPGEPQHPVDLRFGDVARLVGYSLRPQEVSAGRDLDLTLYWEATYSGSTEKSYKVFTHLLDEGGTIIAQHDGAPVSGRRPTHTWQQGDRIIDTHRLAWQTQTYAGTATIAVGLYDFQTQERVPAYGSEGERLTDDRAVLGTVRVK
jgi:hypothetical protein